MKKLIDNFSQRGDWWLPENPKEIVSGRINYNPSKGIKLYLDGFLYDPGEQGRENSIIHGIIHTGEYCTLFNCFYTNWTISGETKHAEIQAYEALFGIHTLIDPKFESVRIYSSGLTDWVQRKRIFVKSVQSTTIITKTNLKPLKYSIPNQGLIVKIESLSTESISWKHIDIKFKECLVIKPYKNQDKKWYRNKVNEIVQLFTLLINRKIIIEAEWFQKRKRIRGQNKFRLFFIDHLIQLSGIFSKTEDHQIRTEFIPFKKVEKQFDIIIANWFKKYAKIKAVMDQYMAAFYGADIGYELKFLSSVRALEAFHRSFFKGKYLSDTEYDVIRKQIQNSIPKIHNDHKEALKSRIYYGNEYSLRKRLKEILDSIYDPLMDLLIDNKRHFIDNIVNTRNCLIHEDESLKQQCLSFGNIIIATHKLKAIIVYLILIEIGINKVDVFTAIQSHKADFIIYEVEIFE
ncbi:MAG: hypothetical protein HQ562_05500 [Candidatus Marinimicrobia bacterium]|nr:hypothetical protein [Candidatus Neomarinimicrobiota bacterium]